MWELIESVRLKHSDRPERPPSPEHVTTEELSALAKQWFSGRTVLYYNTRHGNQIEYYDPSGRCYLWYPRNSRGVPGDFYIEGAYLYARYGPKVYNPVTRKYGGNWEPSSLASMIRDVVDSVPRDVFELSTGRIPFPLRAHPVYPSIAAVKPDP